MNMLFAHPLQPYSLILEPEINDSQLQVVPFPVVFCFRDPELS